MRQQFDIFSPFIISLIYGRFITKPNCCSKLHALTAAQLCTAQTVFQKTRDGSKASCLFLSSHNMSAAAIPQMAGREGREGQLFNPLQCKHDLFEWRSISQDIPVWVDLHKQQRTTVALCLSFGEKSFRYSKKQISLTLIKG